MKCKIVTAAVLAPVVAGMISCSQNKTNEMGSYGYDREFLTERGIETLELVGGDGESRLLVAPGYQGRVMTSSAAGEAGDSYGWINYRFIESGERSAQFNPVGGEERFWLGPEGGAFSLYFAPGEEQIYKNWVVPSLIDTERFDIVAQSAGEVTFTKSAVLENASGTRFDIGIRRTISMLDRGTVGAMLGGEIPAEAKMVAYTTANTIRNNGSEAWTKEGGLVSIWLLSHFTPTPTTTVFIPFDPAAEGTIVNDDYFGKVPSERLLVEEDMIYFKIDGEYRSKIGVPYGRARNMCGSYDSAKKVLTILSYNLPGGPRDYVNGKWGVQDDPFGGDVINAYNDGLTDEGTIMGPFYEIESSSPGAPLAPGGELSHVQSIIHIQADDAVIAPIVERLFGVELTEIVSKFAK